MKIKSILIIISLLINSAIAFEIPKLKILNKKEPIIKPKMIETVQEWEQESQALPLSDRELEPWKEEEPNEKISYPKPNFTFERYNYPPGSREVDISDIKKNLYSYPYIVADNECHYAAYPRYYYSPDLNQITSEFFVEKLDTSKNKTRRILDYNHNQEDRVPVVESGMRKTYKDLFNGLSLVDWSSDGKKVLIKEKIGSCYGGIYKTYLYVHFLPDGAKRAYTIKLENLDRAIKKYYLNYQNLQIVKYRYDIQPLGFSAENEDIIIALSYVYDKNNNKIFLGAWGYNIETNEIMLFTKSGVDFKISSNGLILVKSLN